MHATPSAAPDLEGNRLLAALTPAERERWLSELKYVELPLGTVLSEARQPLSHAYFPTTALVSLIYLMNTGASAEVAVIGNEGVVGISLFMGGGSTLSRVVVQSAGHAFRLPARALREEFDRSGPVMHVLLRFTQALFAQISQTAVCNRHHSLEQQLCRWLLLSMDRLSGDQLVMTHELISQMLGVRREGVSEAAKKLKNAKVIQYARGRITVQSRTRLEDKACECYAVVKEEYERLLPPLPTPTLPACTASPAASSVASPAND